MRLHSLVMHAVGPFAGTQSVDFDRLGAGGLFLFEGPTGVGKSTILDALTFALYGGLASDSGDSARLRSDFAEPGQRPLVQLEFSVRGTRYRITRTPEFTRPKMRGAGFTKEKASVHLESLGAGGWTTRSHAKDEVGTLVSELLGLNRAQFRQVVLLPQGEFATFLRSGDDERRAVLGRLFGTEMYQHITNGLQGRAQEAGRALQTADSELRSRLAAAVEAAGLGADDHERMADSPVAERLAELSALSVHMARQDRAATLYSQSASQAHAEAVTESARAESVVSRLAQRCEVEQTLATAQSQRAAHEEHRATLARGRLAEPLSPLLEQAQDTKRRVALLRQALHAASHPDSPAAEHLAGAGSMELAAKAAAARTTAGELTHVVDMERELPADRASLATAQSAVERLQGCVAMARERVAALPGEVAAARDELAAARLAAARAESMRQLVPAVVGQAAAAHRVSAHEVTVAELKLAVRAAKRELLHAQDQHALLLDQQLADVRGALATRLVAGDPCLVCGSAEHPAPASASRVGVTSEEIREAAAVRDTAQVLLDDARTALTRAETTLEADIRAAAGRSASEWDEEVHRLRGAVEAGDTAQAALAQLERSVAALAEEQVEVERTCDSAKAELVNAQADLIHRERDVAAHSAQVERARGEYDTVRDRAAALAAEATRLEAMASAVDDLARGLSEAASAAERADEYAREAGFADAGGAREALLDPTRRDELTEQVRQWETTIAQALAALSSSELGDVADVDPDAASAWALVASTERTRSAEQERTAREEAALAGRQLRRFRERLGEVHASAQRHEELAATSAELLALDQYARGMAGTPRMSLVTFVLRYWFEQVVAAANLRLQTMSAGKYQLLRVDDGARKSDRVGLGLMVLDRHTGRERGTATLSGGESFYTSLALALGLADVVVAQAGGASLDTLFIDEGFGSLDPDTLDDVMGVIDDLRGNGRVIGIVSHVPELKERIAERLSIRRIRPDGPSQVVVNA